MIVTQYWGHHSSLCALLCNHFQAEMSSLLSLSQATASFRTQDTGVFLHLTACQVEGHNVPQWTRNNWEPNGTQERNGFVEYLIFMQGLIPGLEAVKEERMPNSRDMTEERK